MNQSIQAQVRAFVIQTFLFGDEGHALGPEESLIEAGVVDSTGVLELVAFVEDTFQVEVADAEIVPDNFDSIARIAAYVEGKCALPAVA